SSASRAAALSRSCSILLSSAGVMIVMGLAGPADLLSFALTIAFAPLLFSAPLRTFRTASGSKGNEDARSVLAQPEQSLDLLDAFLDLTILRSLRGNDVAEHPHSFAPYISVSWQKLRESLQCRLAVDEQHVELLSQSTLELLQRYMRRLMRFDNEAEACVPRMPRNLEEQRPSAFTRFNEAEACVPRM